MASILVVEPGPRDEANLADDSIRSRFKLLPGDDPATTVDPATLLDHLIASAAAANVRGVLGSRDRSMHLAVRAAARLSLPGPTPEAFMRCHDKLESRRWQRRLVPEATPEFAALDPDGGLDGGGPALDYPFFLKPITGHLSQLAFAIENPGQLATALARVREEIEGVTQFDRGLEPGGYHMLLAEELLRGRQFTFEGFMKNGTMTPVGVTDSIMHPNGISFERFEYPSVLPPDVQARMADVAGRFMRGIGFDGSLFNMEFFLTTDDRLRIIEVNGRMASQFAPLVRAVHGVSSYELQLDLVAGETPLLPPAQGDMVAASFVMRTYVEDAVVESVPDPAAVLERYPHAQVELLVRPGQRLSENDDDVASHRLALVALAAGNRDALLARFEEAKALLPFDLRPVQAAAPSTAVDPSRSAR